ncbi:MFS transporter [Aspergillus heteromorphus CBS 117.55]|uniref:MFS transporter n=1 Tax=Aspergillus heteromorphus CBS 117.55 TaxID=1448321 RepID=A0A317W7F6_9EURO|nr:MFS transporter [Aspergillus heteromorphus CBS 117.55]PWY81815.1 MFS transporter [Aspergillus heteromorphus CBS 117.55]
MAVDSSLPDIPSESTSLLANDHERPTHGKSTSRRGQQVLLLACLVAVTLDFGAYLSVAPQLQLYESIICQRLHPELFDGLLPAAPIASCKAADVQGELAVLKGWMSTFDQLPSIILALPYGLMADRVGRKRVMLLGLVGFTLQEVAIRIICWYHTVIPPQAIWFTPLFQICGGGTAVTNAVAWTVIADVYPAEKRANAYFVLSAAILASEILAAPLSAWMMSSSLWAPYMLGLAFEIVGLLTVFMIPETKPKSIDEPLVESADEFEAPERLTYSSMWSNTIRSARAQIHQVTDFFFEYPTAIVISFTFLLSGFGLEALQFMVQYASKRFSWSMAEASLLISIKGGFNLASYLVVLPLASKILEGYLSPVRKDLWVSKASACVMTVGFGFMSLASHPAPFIIGVALTALGWGFYASLRSAGSALVGEGHVGLLNTSIALAQGVGLMVAGPLTAGSLRVGMAWEGVWMGLPWMIGVVLFAAAGLAVASLRVPTE